MAAVLLATHPRLLEHDTGPGHPERPARLGAVLDGIAASGLDDALVRVDPRPATRDELEAVHPAEHLDRIEALCRAGGGSIDADTRVSAESWDVALLAAGAGIDAIERLQRGEADAAFCAVRPPGHHATTDRSMGFCLVNNVAIAAQLLADQGERVLVVDIDAHHGNGTQDIFWDDPRVLYVSFHQHPLYPGHRRGRGGRRHRRHRVDGQLPLARRGPPATCTGRASRTSSRRTSPPGTPTWLLISAGFDAHRRDPITGLGLTAGDYADVIGDLLAFAPAGHRLVFLEGGYDLTALGESAAATIGALVGEAVRPEAPTAHGPGIEVLGQVAAAAARGRGPGRRPVIPERLRSSLQPVLDAVAPLAERFAAADHRLYLVGGIVRDLLVGRQLGELDIDLTTDARPEEIKALLAGHVDSVWTQGERFGTIGAKLGDWTVEITTHRAEVYLPETRKPEVTFSDRGRSRPVPPRLHRQRHGAGPARAPAHRPVRRRRRPRRRPPAHAAGPRGVVQRRPPAHAAGGPLPRRLRPGPERRAGRRRAPGWATDWPSSPPSASGTSSTS